MKKILQHVFSFRVLTASQGCTTTRNKSVYPIEFSMWSKRMVWILTLTLLMCLVITSCTPLVLYPLARAWGGPKESELKVIRESFTRMQRDLPTSKLAVYPSCLTNDVNHEWKSETPELMMNLFQGEHGIEKYAMKKDPDVAFRPFGRTLTGFMWDRAWMYAAWVRDTHPLPEGEYAMFTDFICPPDSNCSRVDFVYVYIIDSTGNICIASSVSSRYYKIYLKIQPNSLEDCCIMAVNLFLWSFKHDVMQIYPPYGVG